MADLSTGYQQGEVMNNMNFIIQIKKRIRECKIKKNKALKYNTEHSNSEAAKLEKRINRYVKVLNDLYMKTADFCAVMGASRDTLGAE